MNPGNQKGRDIILCLGETTHHFTLESTFIPTSDHVSSPHLVAFMDTGGLLECSIAARDLIDPDEVKERLKFIRDPKIREILDILVREDRLYPVPRGSLDSDVAYHGGCTLYRGKDGSVIDKLDRLKIMGYYGGLQRVSYFGFSKDDAMLHGLGNYNEVTERRSILPDARISFLTISVPKLLDSRNIFYDPESLLPGLEHEFGLNFFVHKGIPISAISKIDVLRYEGFEIHKTQSYEALI